MGSLRSKMMTVLSSVSNAPMLNIEDSGVLRENTEDSGMKLPLSISSLAIPPLKPNLSSRRSIFKR